MQRALQGARAHRRMQLPPSSAIQQIGPKIIVQLSLSYGCAVRRGQCSEAIARAAAARRHIAAAGGAAGCCSGRLRGLHAEDDGCRVACGLSLAWVERAAGSARRAPRVRVCASVYLLWQKTAQ